jgi:DNA-binding MarR family transcriptional regulator
MDEIALMGSIYKARKRVYTDRLRRFEISLPQLHLVQLARRRRALSHAAAALALDCDRPTLTVVARHCIEKGWLRRRPSPTDRRSALLELTGSGEELLDRIEASRLLAEAGLGDALDVLDKDERQGLALMLERVKTRAEALYAQVQG